MNSNYHKLTVAQLAAAKPMPIFKRELRHANRECRKSQTRRIINPQPSDEFDASEGVRLYHPTFVDKKSGEAYPGPAVFGAADDREDFVCPYGQPGDIRYMREPIRDANGTAYWTDTDEPVFKQFTAEEVLWRWQRTALPQIHMPKAIARLFFELVTIRVERLQDISEADAYAEGIGLDAETARRNSYSPIKAYRELWESINGPGSWEANPFVWVVEYKTVNV